jgi:hypothetical protein
MSRDPAERYESMDALLEDLDRDESDSEIGRNTRMFVGGVMGTLWTALPLYGAFTHAEYPTQVEGIAANALLLAIALGVGWWARDSLTASTFNRQIRAIVVFVFIAQFTVLFALWFSDQDRASGFQLMLYGWFVIGGMLVIVVEQRLWPAAAGYFLCFIAFARWPDYLWWCMASGNFVLTLNCLWIWRPTTTTLRGRLKRRHRRRRGLVASASRSRHGTSSATAPGSSAGVARPETPGSQELAETLPATSDQAPRSASKESNP